jgi:hypothetical protein
MHAATLSPCPNHRLTLRFGTKLIAGEAGKFRLLRCGGQDLLAARGRQLAGGQPRRGITGRRATSSNTGNARSIIASDAVKLMRK